MRSLLCLLLAASWVSLMDSQLPKRGKLCSFRPSVGVGRLLFRCVIAFLLSCWHLCMHSSLFTSAGAGTAGRCSRTWFLFLSCTPCFSCMLGAALELSCPVSNSLLHYSHTGEQSCGMLRLCGDVGGVNLVYWRGFKLGGLGQGMGGTEPDTWPVY